MIIIKSLYTAEPNLACWPEFDPLAVNAMSVFFTRGPADSVSFCLSCLLSFSLILPPSTCYCYKGGGGNHQRL